MTMIKKYIYIYNEKIQLKKIYITLTKKKNNK